MKIYIINILKLLSIIFTISNCHESQVKSGECSPEQTKSLREKIIDAWFEPHERDNVLQKIQINLIWQKRLAQILENGNSKKFKKELDTCDQVIGLRQCVCPISIPLIGQAVLHGKIDHVDQMIKYDFNPNIEYLGMTPLNIALRKVDYRLLNILLTSPKIDLNKLDSAGFSPLNIAMISNNSTQIAILLNHGASIIDPKTTIYNIDLKNCKNIISPIKNLIADYSEGVKIARTPYERWLSKN
jgi:hypothetical protein